MQAYTGGNYLSIQFPTLPFIIGSGILTAESRAVLFGPQKLGKSLIMNQVSLSVINGTDWMGFKTNRKRVLYYNWEVTHPAWQERYRKYSNGVRIPMTDDLVLVSNLKGTMLDIQMGQIEMEDDVKKWFPELIIIDPWYKTLSKSTSDDDTVIAATRFLDYLIATYRVTIVIVHHTRKGMVLNGNVIDMGAQEMRGSLMLAQWVDSIISFSPTSTSMEKGIISFQCRQAPAQLNPFNVELDRSIAGWRVVP